MREAGTGAEAGALLDRARVFLDTAQLVLDHGDTASSISRSYYAMFLAAEAALLMEGVTPGSHRGVIAAFGERFVKTGLFTKEEGRSLAVAHEQRLAADYDAARPIPAADARRLLDVARGFVTRVRHAIHTPGP